MTIKLKEWNILDHLKTPEEMTLYLEACLDEAGDDSEFIVKTLCEIAKAKHLTSLKNNIEQEKRSFDTVFGLIKALGFQLKVTPVGSYESLKLERYSDIPSLLYPPTARTRGE